MPVARDRPARQDPEALAVSLLAYFDTSSSTNARMLLIIGADRAPYEAQERRPLCRCGQSRNKPFCDGSHWYADYRTHCPRTHRVRPETQM